MSFGANQREYDVEVQVIFYPTAQGGRSHPVFSGYRPQFYYNNHNFDAMYVFKERESVILGETIIANLLFLSPELHHGRVFVGMPFEVREGIRVVGKGIITKILNLPHSAQLADKMRPKLYFRGTWPEPLHEEQLSWGGVTYYFECVSSGYPIKQIQIYDNGNTLLYDMDYLHDQYGTLSESPIEPFDHDFEEISQEVFYEVLQQMKPINR